LNSAAGNAQGIQQSTLVPPADDTFFLGLSLLVFILVAVGIAVGVILLVVLIVVLICCCCCRGGAGEDTMMRPVRDQYKYTKHTEEMYGQHTYKSQPAQRPAGPRGDSAAW
jgi:hypothetical protein